MNQCREQRTPCRRPVAGGAVMLMIAAGTATVAAAATPGRAGVAAGWPPVSAIYSLGRSDPLCRSEAAVPPSAPQRFIDERGAPRDRPSRGKTILLSALLPGLGQEQWGDRPAAVGFFLGEVASWTGFIVFRTQGSLRKDRYIDYAERFAGVQNASGQSDDYYQALGRYDRSDPGPGSYNEIEVRLEARDQFFDDPEAQARYIEENSITGDLAWNWESAARRREFSELRASSESAYHRSEFAIGGLIAGRILSMMHAIWLTSDRLGDADEDKDDNDQIDYQQRAGLAATLSPYFRADIFDGNYRLGIRSRF